MPQRDNVEQAEAGTDGERLCLACGLCCKGLWFPHVILRRDEVETAILAKFPVEVVGEETVFYQPCGKHQDGKCSAHATWRPSACVAYRCRLLQAYVKGEVSLDEAIGHVNTASGMADELRTDLAHFKGGLRGVEFVTHLHQAAGTDSALPPFEPQTMLNAVALNLYYTRHFKKRDEPDSGL
jgi:hypothetical protein